jgi:hypothetical protein
MNCCIYLVSHLNIQPIIFVLLCGCKTWFVALKEDNRLRMFEKRLPSRMFEPKREEVNKRMEKITQLTAFIMCTLHQILVRMRWARYTARMMNENACDILVPLKT